MLSVAAVHIEDLGRGITTGSPLPGAGGRQCISGRVLDARRFCSPHATCELVRCANGGSLTFNDAFMYMRRRCVDIPHRSRRAGTVLERRVKPFLFTAESSSISSGQVAGASTWTDVSMLQRANSSRGLARKPCVFSLRMEHPDQSKNNITRRT